MHGHETPDAYLNRAQEYADALAAIGEPVKDKDLVMLVVSGLCEEYNGLKTTITARQSLTAFSELHALLSDHDYMLGKTRAPAPSITSSFATNYVVGSPSMSETLSGANSHVTPDLEVMDSSEAYYGDDALHVGNVHLHRAHRSSPSSVSHLSTTSQTSPGSSNDGLPSPVSTTSIPTPPLSPSIPPPHPPITQQRLVNLRQNPNQRWRQEMKEEYDALMKNETWSLVPRASNINIVDCNNKGTINNIISQLGSAFALKDLGPLNYYLGIKLVPHVSDILLSQKKYVLELLQSAGLSNCNPVSSPIVTSSSLSLDDNTAFSNPVKYRQVVGSLQYVILYGPDIAFVVNKVCQYMHAPTQNHWSIVKRILCYLYGTAKHGMLIRCFSGSTLQDLIDVLWKGNLDTSLKAFLNADWVGDSDDRRSSTEVEYKAIADTVAELTWLQALLHELGNRLSLTPILWCDNLGATYLLANPIFCARIKHVEIDYYFVREKVSQGDL
ncbi:retrovirus-related pol polyprotein from transposon TNT 1-94 [Tanacetum coccineum]